jgi:hypothetical protein
MYNISSNQASKNKELGDISAKELFLDTLGGRA